MFNFPIFKAKWDLLLKMDQHWMKDDDAAENEEQQWQGCRGYLWIDEPVKECAKRQNLKRKDEGDEKEHTFAEDENDIVSLKRKFVELIEGFPEWANGIIHDINQAAREIAIQSEFNQLQQDFDAVNDLYSKNTQALLKIIKNKPTKKKSTTKVQLCEFEPTNSLEKSPQNYFFDLFHYLYIWSEDLLNDLGENDNWFINPESAGLFKITVVLCCLNAIVIYLYNHLDKIIIEAHKSIKGWDDALQRMTLTSKQITKCSMQQLKSNQNSRNRYQFLITKAVSGIIHLPSLDS